MSSKVRYVEYKYWKMMIDFLLLWQQVDIYNAEDLLRLRK